jgi:hypothetical protein
MARPSNLETNKRKWQENKKGKAKTRSIAPLRPTPPLSSRGSRAPPRRAARENHATELALAIHMFVPLLPPD